VAAEKAILAGQFNIAKILRAAAYTQRALAMNATTFSTISTTAFPVALLKDSTINSKLY
jgi:hypothetical protein